MKIQYDDILIDWFENLFIVKMINLWKGGVFVFFLYGKVYLIVEKLNFMCRKFENS